MDLKNQIIDLIKESGLENKSVVSILDEVRKKFHNRRNVGDKVLSERVLSEHMQALIYRDLYPLSKNKREVYYKGAWRKVYGEKTKRYIIYLKGSLDVKFKRK